MGVAVAGEQSGRRRCLCPRVGPMTESPLNSSDLPVSYDPICDFAEWATLTVDTGEYERLQARLGTAQAASSTKDIQWAQDRILRATAFETGAVEDLYAEGATYSVAMEVDGWENDLAESGDGAGQHFEDQLAAYVAVRDLATQISERPFLETDIRELHRIATRSQETYPVQTPFGVQQQPFAAGAYKTKPNQVVSRAGRIFQYAPVDDVSPEMERLVSTMRSEAYTAAHPVIQCAYVHWTIAHIHPFADGNGRMARVVGSIPLLTQFGIPLVVFAGRKRVYLQALESADRHAHQEMVDYISARAVETYSWLAELFEGAIAEDEVGGILKRIGHLLDSEADTLETSEEAADRVETAMHEAVEYECTKKFDSSTFICEVSHETNAMAKDRFHQSGFYHVYQPLNSEVRISLRAKEVAEHSTITSVQLGYTDVLGHPPLVVVHDMGGEEVYFSLEDCSPDLSVGADLRIRNLAGIVVTHAAKKFGSDLAGIYKQHGRHPSDDE